MMMCTAGGCGACLRSPHDTCEAWQAKEEGRTDDIADIRASLEGLREDKKAVNLQLVALRQQYAGLTQAVQGELLVTFCAEGLKAVTVVFVFPSQHNPRLLLL